jgi:hypothetical protein
MRVRKVGRHWHEPCEVVVANTTHRLPSLVRTRVIPAEGHGCVLEQVSWLTPYEAETIAQAARRAGPGARLEVIVPGSASAASLAAVETLFSWLVEKGVMVSVGRGNGDG